MLQPNRMIRTYFSFLTVFLLTSLGYGINPNLEVVINSCFDDTEVTHHFDAPPTVTCPGNVTVFCQNPDLPSLTPTATDDNGVVLQTYTLTGATTGSSPATGINDASSESFLFGVTTVTYYVEDAQGASDSCSFTVTITDNNPPLILCPPDISVDTDPGVCYAQIDNLGFATAWDSCSGIVLTRLNIPPMNQYPPGTTAVTWIVTDAAGNTASCVQNVTVTDNELPSIVCGPDITVNVSGGNCDTGKVSFV